MIKNSGGPADPAPAPRTARRARLAALITALVALGLLALPASSLAATFTVNTTADNAPSEIECSGAAGDCSLRQAIDRANNDPTDDTINVPAGDYHLTIPGADETNDVTGDLDVNKTSGTLSIVGTDGARNTTVDASGLGDRVLQLVQGTLTISGLTITGGSPPSFEGGGGILTLTGTLTVNDSTISGNSVTGPICANGGGIDSVDNCTPAAAIPAVKRAPATRSTPHATTAVSLNLSGDTISGNSADVYGGGVEVNDGGANVVNTTITGNTAGEYSGGLDTNNSEPVQLVNDTVDANTSLAFAGGIYVSPGMSFVNTIVAENTAAGGPSDCQDASGATPTDNGHNIDSSGTCFSPSSTNGDKQGNPDLGALQNNGGPTDTMALLDGSPAINAGDNASAPSTDQRGIARPQPTGGTSDIGAYEATTPDAVTGKASNVKETSATLNGEVNPEDLATTYYFQYGTSNKYGHNTKLMSLGSGNPTPAPTAPAAPAPGGAADAVVVAASAGSASQASAVSAAISHLKPSTTYHFRLVATNQVGTTYGSDRTFRTTGFKGAVAPRQTDRVNSAGHTTTRVNCPSSTNRHCVGTLTLSYHGKVVGRGTSRFTIGSGRSHRVKVHLTSAGRRLLGRTGRLRVRATVKSHDAAGARRTRVSTITLVEARPPAFTG